MAATETQSKIGYIPKAVRKEWAPRREIKFKQALSVEITILTNVKGLKQCGTEIADTMISRKNGRRLELWR